MPIKKEKLNSIKGYSAYKKKQSEAAASGSGSGSKTSGGSTSSPVSGSGSKSSGTSAVKQSTQKMATLKQGKRAQLYTAYTLPTKSGATAQAPTAQAATTSKAPTQATSQASKNTAQARSGKSRDAYDSSVRSRYTQREAQQRIEKLKKEKTRLEAGLDLTGAAQVQEQIDSTRRKAAQKKTQDYTARRAATAPNYQTSEDAQFDIDMLKQSRSTLLKEWGSLLGDRKKVGENTDKIRELGLKIDEIDRKLSAIGEKKTTLEDQEAKALYGEGYRSATLKDLTWNSLKQGYNNAIYGQESFREMSGKKNQKQKYEDILAGEDYRFVPNGALEKAVSGGANLLGQMARQVTDPESLILAGGMGALAFTAGQAGPQVLSPEEVITVPSAFMTGLQVGSARENLEIEAGLAYNEMIENGISEDTARKVALGVGTANAGLEMVQLDKLVDAFKVVKKSGAADGVADVILQELVRRGVDVASETAQEVAQEGVTIAGNQMASKLETGEWAYGADEVKDRLLDTAQSSALSFAALNVPSAVHNTYQTKQADRQIAKQNEQLAKIGENFRSAQETLVERGLSFPEESQAHQTATQMQEKMSAGETLTDTDLGQMVVANERTRVQQRQLERANNPERETETAQADTVSQMAARAAQAAQTAQTTAQAEKITPREQLERAKTSFGEHGAKAMTAAYDGKQDTSEYVGGFAAVYQAGVTGKDMNEVSGRYAGALTEAQRYAAYSAGQNDAALSLRREKQAAQYAKVAGTESGLVYDDFVRQAVESGRTHVDVNGERRVYLTAQTADKVNRLAKALGLRVRFVDSVKNGKANAQISGDTMLIEKDNPNPVLFLLGHEATHRMQQMAPEVYRAYREAIIEKFGPDVIQARIDAYAEKDVELTYEEAMDEIAADYAGLLMDGGRVLDEFIEKHREDKSMLAKLRDVARFLVSKLTGAEKRKAQTAEGKLTAALEAAYKQTKNLTKAAAQNAAKEQGGALQGQGGDGTMAARESLKGKYWRPDLSGDEWELLNRRMDAEIDDPAHALDEATQWTYADEKGTAVFAFYGIGDGTEATPLYAVGGKKARVAYEFLMGKIGGAKNGINENGEDIGSWFNSVWGNHKHDRRNSDAAERAGESARGTDQLHVGASERNAEGTAGAGNRNGEVNTRFSMKTPVEETNKLVALHNLTEKNLTDALGLGGLPMPSIAVVKAKAGHSKYGPISLVFDKATIDPQADSRNKVYGGDAWTPTAPRVEYEVNSEKLSEIEGEIYRLSGSKNIADGIFANGSVLRSRSIGDSSSESVAELAERLADTEAVQAAYLADHGEMLEPVKIAKKWNKYGNDTLKKVIDRIGVQEIAAINARMELGENAYSALGENKETISDILREYYRDSGEGLLQSIAKKRHWTEAEIEEKRQTRINNMMEKNASIFTLEGIARDAWQMYQDGGATKGEIDRSATEDALYEKVKGKDVAGWLKKKLDGLLGEAGIYNGKDPYNASGSSKSFAQLHYPYTLENIVKAMQSTQEERGGAVFGVSAKTIQSVATPQYGSIQAIKADSGRLGKANTDDYNALAQEIDDKIDEMIGKVKKTNAAHDDNFFIESDIIGEVMLNAARGKRTIDSIVKSFAKDGYKISTQTAKELQTLYKAAANLPTEYFEAKPQRAVGFDEVLAAVIPDDSSQALRDGLEQTGVRMLEYKTGDEADRLAKVNSVEGARFSMKNGTLTKSYAAILEENRLLQEQTKDYAALLRRNKQLEESRDYWQGQTRRTKRVTTDKKAVEKAAKALVKSYRAELNEQEVQGIRDKLQSLYDYMASGQDGEDELTYTEARRRAEEIGQELVENAVAQDDEFYQQYSDLREFMRSTPLTVTDQVKGDIADYGAFRKENQGRMRLVNGEETNIDQVYQELSERWPEFFDETVQVTPTDQLLQISQVLREIGTITEYNPYSTYMEQVAAGAANEIMECFFDLPQTRKTFADRAALRLQEAKGKDRLRLEQTRERNRTRLAELRAQNRERVKNAIAQEKKDRDEKLAKLKEHYAARDAKGRERRAARELRAKIIRHAKALSQKLLRPTDQKHIPEALRGVVATMLESINLESAYTLDENGKRVKDDSGAPTKRTEAFRALRDQYARIAAEGGEGLVIDPALFGDAEKDIQGGFDAVIALGDRKLADLNSEELETVWNVVRAVEWSVSTANKSLTQEKYARTQDWAAALRADSAGRRPRKGMNLAISLKTPYTFFAQFGQAGLDIFRMLRDAQDRQQVMLNQVTQAVRNIVDPKTVQRLEKEHQTYTLESGLTLTLTRAQAMEVYLLSKRPQALEHLLAGGVVQPEVKSTKIKRGTNNLALTEQDVKTIIDGLSDEEVKIADGLQRLTGGMLADFGNEASMKAYGYRKFVEGSYWPIKTAKEGRHSSVDKSEGNARSIKNIGLAKAVTPHAKNAMDLNGVFTTFANHTGDMVDYAAWLCPMEDASRLFNFAFEKTEDGAIRGDTVQGLLNRVGGEGSEQYWQKLMTDIQNGITDREFEPLSGLVPRLVGNFKGSAVGGNIRVVIQQPTAFFRAAAVLEPKDMAKGLVKGVTAGDGWKKALTWSPIAMRKDTGGFDIASPANVKQAMFDGRSWDRKLNDTLSAPAGAADAVTWGRLWNACEWAVQRERPGLKAGSEDFYKETAKRFAEVIDQTQVVDGVLQRSNIMRARSDTAKQATSFMGEPIMSLNLLMRAWDGLRMEEDPKRRSRAIKTLGRAATALLVTNVVNAMAQSIVDAMRDDDEDRKYWERFLTAFLGQDGTEATITDRLAHFTTGSNVSDNMNPVAQIPYAKDVLSLLQGYEVTRTDMEVLSDITSAAKLFVKSADGQNQKTRVYAVKSLAAATAKLFGLPVANLTRDIWAGARSLAVETGNVPLQYEMEKAIYNLGYSSNKGRYLDILYRALEQGDTDTYNHIREDLMGEMGVSGVTIDSGMRSRYDSAVEKDPDYTLSQRARDLIGSLDQYAPDEEKETEETFGADDLDSSAYQAYADQRADDYRSMADGLEDSPVFRDMDDETRDKALEAAYDLADKSALADHSGGQYEMSAKWMLNAREAEQKYGIDQATYVLLKTEVSGLNSLTDRNGETIDNSKSLLIMEAVYDYEPRLSEEQRTAMFAYLNVGKKVRHLNKAAVKEKLAKLRSQAG